MMCLVNETTRDHIGVAQRGEYLISGFVLRSRWMCWMSARRVGSPRRRGHGRSQVQGKPVAFLLGVAGSLRVLANASKEFQPHAMPNRSMTARLDSEKWIAQPVLPGLLKSSFVSDNGLRP
jgi:hypothetical protein